MKIIIEKHLWKDMSTETLLNIDEHCWTLMNIETLKY